MRRKEAKRGAASAGELIKDGAMSHHRANAWNDEGNNGRASTIVADTKGMYVARCLAQRGAEQIAKDRDSSGKKRATLKLTFCLILSTGTPTRRFRSTPILENAISMSFTSRPQSSLLDKLASPCASRGLGAQKFLRCRILFLLLKRRRQRHPREQISFTVELGQRL